MAFARGLAEAGANVAIFDVIDPDAAFENIAKDFGVRTAFYKSVFGSSIEVPIADPFAESMFPRMNLLKMALRNSKKTLTMPLTSVSLVLGSIVISLS